MIDEPTITIKRKFYETLKRSHDLLMALQECGVDNWDGYSQAVNIAFPDEDEEDEV